MGLSDLVRRFLPRAAPPPPSALPPLGEVLDGFRADAQAYYASSPEYADGVEEIRDIFAQIRGRVIAVDIDGTLLSSFMGLRFWRERYGMEPHDRVVRPFANEFLAAIADAGNCATLWTGIEKKRFPSVVTKVEGFEIPRSFGRITREDYLRQLKAHPDYSSLEGRITQYPRLQEKLKAGTVKIPGWINFEGRPIDGLIDDNAGRDGEALELLGLGAEVAKLFQVSSFDFFCGGECDPGDVDDLGGLSVYFKDEGLLRVAREMRTRWVGAGAI